MTPHLARFALLGLASAAFAIQGPQLAHARYDERDAQRACEREVSRSYGYSDVSDTQVSREGNHDYRVTGEIRIHGAKNKRYVCKIKHDEVVNVKVLDADHHNGSSDHDGAVATAVGIGVLGLALAAAAASGDESSSGQPYQWQDTGGSPFDDYDQLKSACKHELERHLNADHGRVKQVSIRGAHLDRRDLKGDAHVAWRGGEEADLRFDCAFDRQGRIFDGTYHYSTMTSHSANRTPSPEEQACLASVSRETDNGDVMVLSSSFSQAGTEVVVGVGPQRAHWRCIAYRDGSTAGIEFMGSEGAL